MDKKAHQLGIKETFRTFLTDPFKGLSSEEAQARQARDGFNEFEKTRHTTLWQKFISQFKSFMIIVLIFAAIISGVTGYMNGEGITDAIIILSILIVNAIIGVFQEAKAEKSLDALEKLSAPHCKVIRDGETKIIESRDLVVGDIVVIETGDHVPADLRLIESVNLKIQEAALTGESVPVEKDADALLPEDASIGDRINMAYSSSSVTYGHGKGVVTAIGNQTEVGKIASMIQSVPDIRTPMQMRLDKLGKTLAVICLVVCVVIMIIGLCYGRNLLEMFMTAVSLAVASIPEGLPAVSTVVLALGVQRLAKQNAIVRNLPSVETLGSTTVICSDKTGTLTQNRMTVTHIYAAGKLSDTSVPAPITDELLKMSVLANDAVLGTDGHSIGDPTETALIDAGVKHSIDKNALDAELPRIAEIPFDSERKLMTTVHQSNDKDYLVAVKGGLDELLANCTRINDGTTIRPLTEKDIENIHKANVEMASQALRVLAVGYKIISELPAAFVPATLENEFIFLGMVGMIDPPREEAKEAVRRCKEAGIRPVMITGDHKITATAIARSLGIITSDECVLTGKDVEMMDDEQLKEMAGNVAVFARVAPEHKVRIVNAFQSRGNVVAMTGDGVNDAPALKLADIGVAMGITGTDVAKEAADVVLADDNFATIVSSVREGRRIYDNLMKSIQFMISTNLGEIVVLLIAVLANLDMPLLPIQLLFINLVGDSLPSLALSVDHADKDIMRRKPIDPDQGIFTKHFTTRVILQALIIGLTTLAAYMIGMKTSVDVARTMTFATMVFSQFTIIFSIRSGHKWFTHKMFTNRWLWLTIAFVTALTLLVLLVPGMQSLFKLAPMTSGQWWTVIGLSFGVLAMSEFFKLFTRKKGR
ncbi:MAG: calcium-translocating P-type ATPase, PMCA-type [Bacteroidales bacterium]|nr:calcium-translocating P-type ATPase, PMCA-type [Bacteroidales bacterium]